MAEPGKPRPRLRRGKKKGKGNHSDKSWTLKDPNLRNLLITLLRQTCANTNKLRLHQSAAMDTLIADAKSKLDKALQEELELFKDHVEQLGAKGAKDELRALGPPTAGMVVAMVEAIMQMDVGGAAKKELADWLAKVQPEEGEPTVSKEDIEDEVSFVRLEKCHDKDKVQILIGMNGWSLRSAVLRAVRAEGSIQICRGPPPSGWMEDELSSWLEALEL